MTTRPAVTAAADTREGLRRDSGPGGFRAPSAAHVPPAGLEPAHPAPEAGALSTEL